MFDIGPEIKYWGYAVYFFAAILGLILGSFLNSWIWRTRENIRVIGRTFSMCVNCHRRLKWYENIPLFSYLYQHGQCRSCKKRIPAHYPLVEFFTAALLVLIFHHSLWLENFSEWILLRDILFLAFLMVIFVYDWLYFEVITVLPWVGGAVGFLINYFYLNYSLDSLLLGLIIGGGFFGAQYFISKGRWIGGGDVRLGAMMGLWLGAPATLVALPIAYILGALVGLGLLIAKKAGRKTEVPFASFLSVGIFVAMLYGKNIVAWYLRLLN